MRSWRLAANSAKARISTSTQTWNVGRRGGAAMSTARTAATHRRGRRTAPAVSTAAAAVRAAVGSPASNRLCMPPPSLTTRRPGNMEEHPYGVQPHSQVAGHHVLEELLAL